MTVLSTSSGYVFLAVFAVLMFLLTWYFSRADQWRHTQEGFLAAGREVPWTIGAPSIAASWIWAPALFVSVQWAYELGLPGIFWFTAPNILALAVFAFLAPKVRDRLPGGFTLPEWIRIRLGDRRVHRLYMVPFLWYQLMAICVQLFVGGMIVEFLTGIPLNIVMVLLAVVGLSYSLVSGLRASIVTDFVQMAMIFVVGIIIIPWTIKAAGGWNAVEQGLGGLAGNRNIFDPEIAFAYGIVTSIGLLAGSISDQQYWQRSFAIKRTHLRKAFIAGAILFGIVPIALSILGFLAANPALGISLPEGTGLPMIGVASVVTLLPAWAAVLFVFMLLAGLSSTLDSGLCAAGSLFAVDIADRSENSGDSDLQVVKRSRQGMVAIAFLGLLLAIAVQYLFTLDQLWWIFNGVASCFVVPTVLSLFWDRLSARGVFWGLVAAGIGILAFIYGNYVGNNVITVFSAVFIILASLIACLAFPLAEPWTPSQMTESSD